MHISCAKTGYNASVTFHTKPFYGGRLHRVTGEVKNASTGRVICKVNGEWNGRIEISFTSHQVCDFCSFLCFCLLFLRKWIANSRYFCSKVGVRRIGVLGQEPRGRSPAYVT